VFPALRCRHHSFVLCAHACGGSGKRQPADAHRRKISMEVPDLDSLSRMRALLLGQGARCSGRSSTKAPAAHYTSTSRTRGQPLQFFSDMDQIGLGRQEPPARANGADSRSRTN